MEIFLDNKKYNLQKTPLIGSGGEANVFQINGDAVKVFHKLNQRKNQKLSYLKSIRNQLPKNLSLPISLTYNNKNEICGYSMNFIEQSFITLNNIRNKKYRNLHPEINNKTITELLLNIYDTTEKLHPNGVIVGDYNDLNILFHDTKSYFIDTDSFQMQGLPCEVGMEEFLDPNLYDIDLAQKCYFNENND